MSGKFDPSLKYKECGTEYLNGPDQLLPSEEYFTSDRNGAVHIRGSHSQGKGEGEIHATPRPLSLPTLLMNTVKKFPEYTALAMKRDGEWVEWNYRQFLGEVRSCAKAFIHLGLQRLHTVGILGFNTPEWFIAESAAIFAGGVAMGIYTTNSPDSCRFNLEDSQSNIAIVENESLLQKILPYRKELKHLKAIIQYDGEVKHEGVMSWSQLLHLGETLPDAVLDDRLKRIAINQMCILVYTSGTTGNPKGVMLSHDNMYTSAVNIRDRCTFNYSNERYVSFLPLSHVAAQAVDMFTQILCGSAIYFADKDAFRGSLITTMREVHPTVFLSVPRVYEKIHEKVQDQMKHMSSIKRMLFDWARSVGYDYVHRLETGDSTIPFGFQFASSILKKVRDAVGLDQCYFCAAGAASVPMEVLQFLASVNIPVMETFGMSECCGPHTLACSSGFRLGSAGRPFPGGKVRVNGKDKEAGEGELCLWGRNVFMGYLGKPQFIETATEEHGWLKTGDIAKVDQDDFVFITGRIKELLVTAGGENIPPLPIEENIMTALPCVSQAILVGDKKKFVSVLLALKCEVNPETNGPTNRLQPIAQKWCESVGSSATLLSEILDTKDTKVFAALENGIIQANLKAASNPQRVRKWELLPSDLSIAGGELGPTLKVKRDVVMKKYSKQVDSIYNSTAE